MDQLLESVNRSEKHGFAGRPDDDWIREQLGRQRVVAVVGMSPRLDRPSRRIGLYLSNRDFIVIPVHPVAKRIADLWAYSSLEAIPRDKDVEIVDVCVAPGRAGPIADQAAQIGARIIWFQPGAENPAEEQRAKELGLEVVSGRCIMADHRRLIG